MNKIDRVNHLQTLSQFSLFVGAALAAPQGYNYQLNYAPNFGGALTYPQVQLLQKFAAKQEQSMVQQQTVTISEPQAPVQSQNIATVGGSQFANQLIQLANYGQQQQQAQLSQGISEVQQAQTHSFSQQIPSVEQQPLPLALPQPQVHPQTQSPQPAQQQPQTLAQPQLQSASLPQIQAEPQPQPQFLLQPQPQTLPQPQLQPQPQIQQQFFPQSQRQPQLVPQVQPTVQLQPQLAQPIQFQHASPLSRIPEPTYYNKEYYYLSAPQENYELPPDFNNLLSKMKKNLRVVFIKAPEQNGLTKTALQLLKDSQQPKTAIYVLTKQHNAAELAKKLQQQPGLAHQKPEVIFIKYRTRQEAEHAQRTIQSQYESLNGPNHFNFESVVPTQNFIGSTAAIEPRQRPADQIVVTSTTTPSPLVYLPPAE
ncbi:mediator of RNA polymerase II transcription subunit 15-like [Bactrocera tryoni]|uniref:mediator of RNA polymerase II transcription subunit 15-like n=1 Tax=Bactrocera tryoni TaxID=59916 RepID=UPI001A9712CE|nr:mediator of RNA polymerase II transcription subunit 15-like [Bactrocera tryoni]